MRKILSVVFLIAISTFISDTCFAQGVKLLNIVSNGAIKSEKSEQEFQKLKKRKHLSDSRLVTLNRDALDGDWVSLTLPDGNEIQINRISGSVSNAKNLSWIGEIRKGGGEVIFTVTDGILIGNVRLPYTTYTIEPVGDDLYLLSRVSREMMPPPDPASGPAREPKLKSSSVTQSKQIATTAAATGSSVVRILFAYTTAASNSLSGTNGVGSATQAIVTLNQAFTNSAVNLVAELAGTIGVSFVETGNFEKDLASLRVHPTLTTARNSTSADLVITIFSRLATGDNLCGLAYLNPSSESAYGIVVSEWLNAAGDCFAHEVGHLFGADHNTANANLSGSPFAYGHGFQYSNPVIPPTTIGPIGCFKTIMAYDFDCPQGGLSARNQFSNPSVYVQYGDLASRPSGNANSANNARVLNEQGARVAAFRGSTGSGIPANTPGTPQAGAAMAVITNFLLSTLQ